MRCPSQQHGPHAAGACARCSPAAARLSWLLARCVGRSQPACCPSHERRSSLSHQDSSSAALCVYPPSPQRLLPCGRPQPSRACCFRGAGGLQPSRPLATNALSWLLLVHGHQCYPKTCCDAAAFSSYAPSRPPARATGIITQNSISLPPNGDKMHLGVDYSAVPKWVHHNIWWVWQRRAHYAHWRSYACLKCFHRAASKSRHTICSV